MSGSIWWARWVLDGAGRPQHHQPGLLLGQGTRQQGHFSLLLNTGCRASPGADLVMLSDPRALPHHHHQATMLQRLLCSHTPYLQVADDWSFTASPARAPHVAVGCISISVARQMPSPSPYRCRGLRSHKCFPQLHTPPCAPLGMDSKGRDGCQHLSPGMAA